MAKTGKKDKTNVDKIVKKVNKEFEKTSAQVEGLIDDAFKQFDSLQHQVQDPVRKLIKEMEDLREREVKRFHDEFERRMAELQKIQHSLLDRLGIAQREAKRGQKAVDESLTQAGKKAEKTAKKAEKTASKSTSKAKVSTKKAAASTKASAGKAATKAKATADKAATNTKAAAGKTKTAAKAVAKGNDMSDLTRIKGVGPVTATKMQAVGITSINQVANPNEAEQEKLKQFSSMRGSENWPAEAKKLLE